MSLKKIKSDFLDIYQSFEGSYNLEKWIKYYFSDHKNQLLFKDFIDHLREFMNFNPDHHKTDLIWIKNDLVYIRKLFCINKDHKESQIKKVLNIKDWFYDFNYPTRRYFKQITYSSFPKENTFDFINCNTSNFLIKTYNLVVKVLPNEYK